MGDLPIIPSRLGEILGAGDDPSSRLEDLLTADDAWTPGETLGDRYTIDEVHEGGFGRVCICHLAGGQTFALKTPRRNLLRTTTTISAFASEAVRWISLPPHPCIVFAYGLEFIGRRLFLVLEAVEASRTVAHEILAGRHGPGLALRVGAQIAAALAHAHTTLQLVHGDIKPSNILLGPAGTAKLTDFGISYAPGLDAADRSGYVGTSGYVAPELLAGEQRSSRSDTYAFGVTLWQCLTGQSAAADPGYTLPEGIPSSLGALVRDCVSRDGSLRPSSFEALAAELERMHERLLGAPVPRAAPAPGAGAGLSAHDTAVTLSNHSVALSKLGWFDQAEVPARRATALQSRYAAAHDALGFALLHQQQIPEAVDAFTRAVRFDSDDVIAAAHLSLALLTSGRNDEARAMLQRTIETAEERGRLRELDEASSVIVRLLAREEALKVLDRIIDADNTALPTLINRSSLLRSLDRTDEAVVSAQRAVEVNPGDALGWSALSGALSDAGDMSGALEAAEHAVRLDPNRPQLHAQYCVALVRTGQPAHAHECWRRALQRWPDDPDLLRLGA